jgi:pimeloyl-ACP methyl ester carboxylesterase
LRVTPHLKAFSRVVLPDLPGHGFSEMPAPLTSETLLSGTFESLDAEIQAPAVIAGTSLGAYVAIRYALARPHKVRALMLAAPAGAAMSIDELAAFRARFELKTHRDALAFVDALFARPNFFRHVVAMGLRQYFTQPQTLAVLAELRAHMLFTADEVSTLKAPLLFLWGDAERILPSGNLDFFLKNLPAHARVERPAGWGHGGFLDDPRGFAARLTRFATETTC